MKTLIVPFMLVALAVPAQAHEIRAGTLVIVHPSVDEAAKGQPKAQGSMEIRNEGKSAEKLLSIRAEFAETVTIETAGEVVIPPNQRVLIPLVYHHIKSKLAEDEAYDGELMFEKAGIVTIDIMVHKHTHSSGTLNLAFVPFPAW
ncbi:MAG TPA: hypothetical protein VH933_02490 [Aestuariivirgaceae bacterium]|jgi:hypothetical protein